MASLMRGSLNKLFLALSFILLVSFVGAERVESIGGADQKDAATAIANVCAALIEGCGRNPSVCGLPDDLDTSIPVNIYHETVSDIMALNLEAFPDDIALAKGIISAAYIFALARNPSIQAGLEQIKAICNEDIDAL
jgi:F0F1-type ATP synthase membrane subunit c/vacuolar-type H+-ATPase subunit K